MYINGTRQGTIMDWMWESDICKKTSIELHKLREGQPYPCQTTSQSSDQLIHFTFCEVHSFILS